VSKRLAARERRSGPDAARGKAASAPATEGARHPGWDVILVVASWTAFALFVGRGHLVAAYDSFRDMAYAHGILRGEIGLDPTLPGLPAWYPAGMPLLAAAIVRATGLPVATVFGTSLFWFSVLVPLVLHRLVARCFGRAAAWWSLAFVGLGSMWWLTHGAMPMPSIQGAALGLLALHAWLAWRSRPWPWSLAVAGLGALAVAFHPICGAIPMAAILLHGGLSPLVAARDPAAASAARREALRAALAFTAWAALAAALLVPLLQGPILNPAPRLWFGPQLRDPAFAFHAHAPLVLLFGLAGLVRAVMAWKERGWLAAYAVVSLPPLLAGYAAVELGWKVPYLLPHEFQWHLQLAWGVAAAVAMLELAALLVRRWRLPPAVKPLLAVALAAVVVGPALSRLPQVTAEPIVLDRVWTPVRRLAERMRSLGASGQVIAGNPSAGYVLAGLAGTRALLLPEGHMNPRADLPARLQAVSGLLQAESESAFVARLARTPADWLLHEVADSVQRQALFARHERWSVLEPIPLENPDVLLYRIRPAAARSSSTPSRP
jgi:hypothetical protein